MIATASALVGAAPSAVRADQASPPAAATPAASIEICLVPLGRYDAYQLDKVVRGIRYLFGFSVRALEPRGMPEQAYYEPRKRYRAEKLLDYLSAEIVPDAGCFAVVGFTDLDISTTKGKHVDWGILGLGEIGGDTAVVSTYRLSRRRLRGKRPGKRDVARRSIKVTNHELGHVLGLDHGGDKGCLMNDAGGTIRTVDREEGILCEPSRAFIRRQHGVNVPAHRRFDWRTVLAE